jgi:hypothetical protein
MVNPVRGGHTPCGLRCLVGVPEKPGRGGIIDKPDDSVEDRPEKLHGILRRVRRLVHHGRECLSLFLTGDYQDGLLGSLHNGQPQCYAVVKRYWRICGIGQGIIVTYRKFNFSTIY